MQASRFQCGECGYVGAPEPVMEGFSICPECGAVAPTFLPAGPASSASGAAPAPFDGVTFRYRSRLYGLLARLTQKLGAPVIRDGGDRVVARVQARSAGVRRVGAVAAGAAFLTASALLLIWVVSHLPDSPWVDRLFMYATVPPVLVAALVVVARLSPPPDLLVVGTGMDPRLLLRLRPLGRSGFSCTVSVEDGEGVSLGTLRLDRLRDLVYPLGHKAPLIEIEAKSGPPVRVRRQSAMTPGWLFETAGGEVLATFGLNPGLLTRDELVVHEPGRVDTRLLLAAMLVGRP